MFDTIVAATDGSDHSRRAVDIAAGLAAAQGSKLVLVHVLGHGEVPEGLRRLAEVEQLVKPERASAPQTADVSSGLAIAERRDTEAHLARIHEAIGDRLLADARSACVGAGVENIALVKETGDPAKAIVRCADVEGAGLVVMGTRGMSELGGLLMGSVSHKVCQLAPCPVLTAK